MANEEHLEIIKQGTDVWNAWREIHTEIQPDLNDANLNGANLSRADLSGAKLTYANLIRADLSSSKFIRANLNRAELGRPNLKGANLSGANLSRADLRGVNLSGANLSSADLSNANLSRADLSGADLSGAYIWGTIFGNNNLRQVKGLEAVKHNGPSTIGMDTLMRSEGDIPAPFLKGDHSISGANRLFAMKVPPNFPFAVDADILC